MHVSMPRFSTVVWLACIALPFAAHQRARADGSATVWRQWEQSLTSTSSYANAYRDVTVSVTYTSPSGKTLTGTGFWDGGGTFKIRTMFDEPGTWTWSTSSTDPGNPGLTQQGTVNVAAYSGSNPLYQHGMVTTSTSNRHLTYADGTPTFWLGDTAWIAPLKATQSDWQTYINDRAAKGFNVIQLSIASDWGGQTDRNGNTPFQAGSTSTSLVQWNPAYFQGLDQKIQYANDHGMTVMLVGAMEPDGRYPNTADATIFARNLAARYSGNDVIFSPSFDSGGTSGQITLGNAVGTALDTALGGATRRHLITEHPGTPASAASNSIADQWYSQSYMDFAGDQTGHNNGNRQTVYHNAVVWNLSLYNKTAAQGGPKPVINLEAYYDANGATQDTGGSPAYAGTAKDARATAYLSALSGSAGYTYGVYGLWNWQPDTSKDYSWDKAMNAASSTQMGYFGDFFKSLDWWTLIPHHELIANQNTTDWTKYMAFASSAAGDLGVAYLPNDSSITLNLAGFTNNMIAEWFNPQTSGTQTVAGVIPVGGNYNFTKPAGWDDAVLKLTATSTTPPNPPLSTTGYIDTLTTAGPVAHYRFSEVTGPTAADANLDHDAVVHNGTYVNNPTLGVAGPRPPARAGLEPTNTAVTLNGASQYVSLGTMDNIGSQLASGFTVIAWIQTTAQSSSVLWVGRNNTGSGENVFLQLNRNAADNANLANGLRIYVRDQSNNQKSAALASPTIDFTDGQWHMIAATFTPGAGASGIVFYIDGINAGPVTFQLTQNTTNFGNFLYSAIGAGFNSGGIANSFFNGSIDELSFFNTPLTASQITDIFHASTVPEPAALPLVTVTGAVLFITRRRNG